MATGERKKFWSVGFRRKLAKAETVLVLALLCDALLGPWLYSLPGIPAWGKTLIKMLVLIGCFGPIFKISADLIDRSLNATHTVTVKWFSLPRAMTHCGIFVLLFLGFYWNMHHSTPWSDFAQHRREVASHR